MEYSNRKRDRDKMYSHFATAPLLINLLLFFEMRLDASAKF